MGVGALVLLWHMGAAMSLRATPEGRATHPGLERTEGMQQHELLFQCGARACMCMHVLTFPAGSSAAWFPQRCRGVEEGVGGTELLLICQPCVRSNAVGLKPIAAMGGFRSQKLGQT